MLATMKCFGMGRLDPLGCTLGPGRAFGSTLTSLRVVRGRSPRSVGLLMLPWLYCDECMVRGERAMNSHFWTCVLGGVAVLVSARTSAASETWTEDFSKGPERFSTVIDEGNSVFAYDAMDQNLDCTFVREPLMDRRLAVLTRPFTQEDSFGFAFEWSPISGSLTAFPHIGCFDSPSGDPVIVLKMTDNRYEIRLFGDPGLSVEDAGLCWSFGETYRLEVRIDGLGNSLTLTSWQLAGADFELQGDGSWDFATTAFAFDAVGVGNLVEENPGPTLIADVDNFSFNEAAAIPTASDWGILAMALLTLTAGTLVFRKRRAV